MTIMLYRHYPQATPEQKPPAQEENVSPQLKKHIQRTQEVLRCRPVLRPYGAVSGGCGQHGDVFG